MTEHPAIAGFEAQIARKNILLLAAYDLIKRSTQNHFVEEAAGSCLMDDIAIELDLPDRAQPVPLLQEQP